MNTQDIEIITLGCFRGSLAPMFDTPEILQQLADLPRLLSADNVVRLSHGPDYVVKLPLSIADNDHTIITTKIFKRQSWLKDRFDLHNKSKAERSFRAALYLQNHNIGTPAPIAWLDRWENGRLMESYYLCLFDPAICFRDALADIFFNIHDNEPLIDLLHAVAPAVKAMHDIGFMHGDMGNQNILLPKSTNGVWQKPQFIDLNRHVISATPLNAKQRAFDLSRIALPSAYLKIFKTIYSNNDEIPVDLNKYEQTYRRRFKAHQRSRKLRHPFRTWKRRHQKPKQPTYPSAQDIWLWDEKSAQPMIVLDREERNKYRNWGYIFSMLGHGLLALPGIFMRYKKLISQSYQKSVSMDGRIGVALHPKAHYIDKEVELLKKLGNPPVLIRFCHHETPLEWKLGIDLISQLRAQGIEIMVAILQDRQAVLQPEKWKAFLQNIIVAIADKVTHIEVTHASNRVKWGIWSATSYQLLMQPAFELQKIYPQIKITGPACIDFEYLPVISALNSIPKGNKLAALSHLLYVDRRGAPENKQGKFSTLGKCALLKALAQWSNRCEDKVIISEVNWPVKYTGIWSPIICPYETPKWRHAKPGETEDVYAWYMLRYLAITLCSGHIDQVFWWRLSAHGYGLIDDQNEFKPRPAFTALCVMLKVLKHATFVKKWNTPTGLFILEFHSVTRCILMIWKDRSDAIPIPSLTYGEILNHLGEPLEQLIVSGAPIYLLEDRSAS